MYYYRIHKYKEKITFEDDWTSISDVGRVFKGKLFTFEKYEKMEAQYIATVMDICKKLHLQILEIAYLEPQGTNIWRKRQPLTLSDVQAFMQMCLREKCWGQLSAKDFIWECGYDYYMHIATDLSLPEMECIVAIHGLFIEKWERFDVCQS